ncbi:hypothetical protein VFPPC_17575 [Pochonia chlamydosporia 170]|uniref:Uncharacterized protein n=1 Tax=Pochonia chlamydosporia 170 TaxID=1380566 RepID=A0A219ARM2_METCM|nr:hypothetical protein VFPPC_17575 [Pochonia chlamydosporia 170]OWT43262.1 hypothetical protein VFPPC_17575 [Pochonia chlamydosporia 170]
MLLALHTIFIFPMWLTKELAEQNSKFQVAKWFLDIRIQDMYQIPHVMALRDVIFGAYGVHHTCRYPRLAVGASLSVNHFSWSPQLGTSTQSALRRFPHATGPVPMDTSLDLLPDPNPDPPRQSFRLHHDKRITSRLAAMPPALNRPGTFASQGHAMAHPLKPESINRSRIETTRNPLDRLAGPSIRISVQAARRQTCHSKP